VADKEDDASVKDENEDWSFVNYRITLMLKKKELLDDRLTIIFKLSKEVTLQGKA